MNHPAMQGLNLNTPSYVKNAKLIAWVADMVAICKPDPVYWCDGSDAEYQRLHARPHHVCGAVQHGPSGLADCTHRH